MTLRLPDRWLWDFWVATTNDAYHLFYLQAPRALGNPDLRHRNASVGHAVSDDLTNWDVLGDALLPGRPGAWDDVATWTGSIIEHDKTWYMFYTGTSHAEEGRIQRIGLATSADLVNWEKHGDSPLIQADARWYETYGTSDWPEEAWRDPWVFEADGTFHALITARSPEGPSDGRGVIGHATSTDLLTWIVHPPLSEPGEFGHLEVPQLVRQGDECLLVYSCDSARLSDHRAARVGPSHDAVYVVPTSSPLGPFDITQAAQALPNGFYSGRLIQKPDNTWAWLAFLGENSSRGFLGELSDPIPFAWPAAQSSGGTARRPPGRS